MRITLYLSPDSLKDYMDGDNVWARFTKSDEDFVEVSVNAKSVITMDKTHAKIWGSGNE